MSDSDDNPYTTGPTPRNEATLRRLYYEEQRTIDEVADKLDRSPGTITRWMREFGIERRDRARDSVVASDE